MRYYSYLILGFLLAAFGGSTIAWPLHAEDVSYSDSDIKAVYITNFLSFITFPTIDKNNLKTICVVGDDLVGVSLAYLEKKTDAANHFTVKKKGVRGNLKDCHIVYIGGATDEQIRNILYAAQNLPLITVSDAKNFIDRGGIIGFVNKDNSIKIEINLAAAKETGVVISSKLLQIVTRVIK